MDPDMIDGRFEVYRIATDYEGICDVFRDRVEDIQATRLGIDAAGGFAPGHASTLLCRPQIKGYGPESLTHMLKATGMALVFVIDDERFAAVKERLGKRERPLRPTAKPLSKEVLGKLIKRTFANHGSVGGMRRSALLSPRQRREIAKAGAAARWSKRTPK